MRIYTKSVRSLTEHEYEACHNLNQGFRGMMQNQLAECRAGRSPGRAVMAWDGDKLLGWALKFRLVRWEMYIYVHPSHRCQGIGTKIVAHARMGMTEPIRVYATASARGIYTAPRRAGRLVFAPGYWR